MKATKRILAVVMAVMMLALMVHKLLAILFQESSEPMAY